MDPKAFLQAKAKQQKAAEVKREEDKFEVLMGRHREVYWSSDQSQNLKREVNYDSTELPEGMTVAEIIFWHACHRKRVYATAEEANDWAEVAHAPLENNHPAAPYICKYDEHWHLGRLSNFQVGTNVGEYRRQWRKWRDKPTVAELKEAFRFATNK